MPFFPQAYGSVPSFTPLFRLLEDFDSYSRDAQCNSQEVGRHRRHQTRTFNPKFDVRETENTYELHGELPGIQRDNLQIEFTEPQTIVIRGRVERSYTAGTPPADLTQGGGDSLQPAAIADADEMVVVDHPEEKSTSSHHQASVSDEEAENAKEQGTVTPPPTESEPAKPAEKQQQQQQKPADKYWVSERSIGEFSRSFSFPGRVEQEGVAASLENGVLTVSVPKAKKHESRRIAIN